MDIIDENKYVVIDIVSYSNYDQEFFDAFMRKENCEDYFENVLFIKG